MRTSGLVLEVHDDVDGDQLKSFFPTQDDLPDYVKTAAVVDDALRSKLPDDVFALVLVNGDEVLRKYACVDEGNTALSVLYFIKNAHKLPPEARQQCADNLKVACGWYNLHVPEELEKEAGVAARLASMPVNMALKHPLTALAAPSLAKGTASAISENLARVNQAEAMGEPGLAGLTGKFAAAAAKLAEISGTPLAPISASNKTTPETTLAGTIKKTASTGHLVQGHRSEKGVEPDVNAQIKEKMPVRAPQHMNPVVVVTDREVLRESNEKKAERFALPSQERYPIDSYGDVKLAAAYFEEHGRRMAPVDRREYCTNLVKRANELLIPVSDNVRKYGSDKYAASHEIKVALDTRRTLLNDQAELVLLDKVASHQKELSPEMFAEHLADFDRLTGLHRLYDSHVMDPFYSTFGFQKTAEDEAEWSDTVGNLHITGRELHAFALSRWLSTKKIFGLEFAEEFHKDPITQYKALPLDQKRLLIRLASENAPV